MNQLELLLLIKQAILEASHNDRHIGTTQDGNASLVIYIADSKGVMQKYMLSLMEVV